MPDYSNGKIYKLWSPQGEEIYIGSTVNTLPKRKAEHKQKWFVLLKYYLKNMMMLELN
jgi:hypothetical protein